jgi:polyribonucleotide nucleotidyltransferase
MTDAKAFWAHTLLLGDAPLAIETGRLAAQAAGAVWLRQGRTALLVAVAREEEPVAAAGRDFFPLTVEYREKLAGAGRIPGGFLRREARATSRETLAARLIDRSLRPHFPEGFRCETQVLATLHSFDPAGDPEVAAMTGASMALMISDIPWEGPIAGVRVIVREGVPHVWPTHEECQGASLDLVVAVSRDGLVMVEGEGGETPEEQVLAALDAAMEASRPLLDIQDEMRRAIGRAKQEVAASSEDAVRRARIEEILRPRMDGVFATRGKRARRDALDRAIAETVLAVAGPEPVPDGAIAAARALAEEVAREEIRRRALNGQRLDGRGPEEIRVISGETACLPGAHGSALFTRGETQALVTCTLGTAADEQMVEDPFGLHRERFLLHYNFPSFSVGEVRPLRGPGRREIGHGNLARRALAAVLPTSDAFPYTIRVESEILSSNGSSSMASICGGTLALMDAGVPLRCPVAGIAMGLIAEGDRTVILSDILGDEDHLGDMDFKVAGTETGVTALQLDNKLGSLPRAVLAQALEQARRGRGHILGEMRRICAEPRREPPVQAPRVSVLRIRPVRIRDLIGPGGRHIQGIQQATGVKIDIADDGRVQIFGPPGARLREAEAQVRRYAGTPSIGRVYRGRVTGVKDFGCFVEIFHGIEGLVPIEELDEGRVESVASVARLGDEMRVRLLGVTREGKLQLSRRAALKADPSEIED